MLGKGLESLIPPNQQGRTPGEGSSGAPHLEPPLLLDVHGADEVSGAPPVPHDVSAPAASPAEKLRRKQEPHGAVFQIEVERIKPNPHQPRRNFGEEGIRDLAASIREFGILQPLVVTKLERETPTGVGVEYELIAGERRLMAAKLLGLERVPAIVRTIDRERERLEMAIIENLQREDLNPVEAARAFSRLQEEFRLTQREIAVRLGKSREVVANTVRLLDLPPYIQEALERRLVTESHGRLLVAVSDPGAQKKLFEDLLAHHLTTRELRSRVRGTRRGPGESARAGGDLSQELKAAEERLSAELGTPVSISRSGETGKITITFYSPEELDHILRRLGRGDDEL